MTLEILQVPGCPGADLLAARLDGLLAGRRGVTRRVVASQAEAERLGMTGSPTLLADGADPFARPGLLPAVSCRLYSDEHGQPRPAPSTSQLRATLGLLGARVTGEVRAECHQPRASRYRTEPRASSSFARHWWCSASEERAMRRRREGAGLRPGGSRA